VYLSASWQIHSGELQSNILPRIQIQLPSLPCNLGSAKWVNLLTV
jgi:hypothetical protein